MLTEFFHSTTLPAWLLLGWPQVAEVATRFDTPLGEWLLLVGLFVLGSMLGSFANVVIYRLPAGKSLLWPGSHCPQCGHAIRWHDNVPVFGWLLLNGKCRDCRAGISARYPLVETLFGLLLAALGWLEFVNSGANLPAPLFEGATSLPPGEWLLVGYHMLLVSTLLVAGLIAWDGQPIPRRLLIFALACGLALPLVWSALRPVPLADALPEPWRSEPALRAALEGLAGVAAGLLMGALAWPAIAQEPAGGRPEAAALPMRAVLAVGTVGAFLGWQAVCGIAVLAALCNLLAALASLVWLRAHCAGWCLSLALATFAWLACWLTAEQTINNLKLRPLDLLLAAGCATAAMSLVDWRMKKVSGTHNEFGS